MQDHELLLRHRRRFLESSLLGSAAFFTVPGAFAEALQATPRMTEGPFYPDKLPLDHDNDLVLVGDSITPAVGEITHLHGRVTDVRGRPVRNAKVEIWQVDSNGHYLHSRGLNRRTNAPREKNFQGYGRFLTNVRGEYRFRTIKPVSYPGRTPHIHVAVDRGRKHGLATQCFVKGEKQNQSDHLLRRLGGKSQLVVVEFKPVPKSKTGELSARFDIVLGVTPPEDAAHGAPVLQNDAVRRKQAAASLKPAPAKAEPSELEKAVLELEQAIRDSRW